MLNRIFPTQKMIKNAFFGAVNRNWKDLKSWLLWKGVIAEMVGTGLLILIGCGTCIGEDWQSRDPSVVQISLTFGLAVATIVRCIAHVSGGHINPAVTFAMLITRRLTIARCIVYIIGQLVGAIIGAAILKGITPVRYEGDLGQTSVDKAIRASPDGLVVEGVITFILVYTIFASCDTNRNDLSGSSPLSIGFSVAFCHMFAIKYTGSSMNPARTFGPAVMGGNWDHHFVFWIGPMLGSIVASLSYEFVFAKNAGLLKLKHFFTESEYLGDDPFHDKNFRGEDNNFESKDNDVTEDESQDAQEFRVITNKDIVRGNHHRKDRDTERGDEGRDREGDEKSTII